MKILYHPKKKNKIITVDYGFLYNWYAATDLRNIASSGWRVPTTNDSLTLFTSADGFSLAGQTLKETGTQYWTALNNGTNKYKFNGRGSGHRRSTDGVFSNLNNYFDFLINSTGYIIWSITSSTSSVGGYNDQIQGAAIRLVKESTSLSQGEEGIYTGNNGLMYRTICIGSQEWLADNLCETKYRNGDAIPEVTDNSAWISLTSGAFCLYENDWDNGYQ